MVALGATVQSTAEALSSSTLLEVSHDKTRIRRRDFTDDLVEKMILVTLDQGLTIYLDTELRNKEAQSYRAAGVLPYHIASDGRILILMGMEFRWVRGAALKSGMGLNCLGGKRDHDGILGAERTAAREFYEETGRLIKINIEDRLKNNSKTNKIDSINNNNNNNNNNPHNSSSSSSSSNSSNTTTTSTISDNAINSINNVNNATHSNKHKINNRYGSMVLWFPPGKYALYLYNITHDFDVDIRYNNMKNRPPGSDMKSLHWIDYAEFNKGGPFKLTTEDKKQANISDFSWKMLSHPRIKEYFSSIINNDGDNLISTSDHTNTNKGKAPNVVSSASGASLASNAIEIAQDNTDDRNKEK